MESSSDSKFKDRFCASSDDMPKFRHLSLSNLSYISDIDPVPETDFPDSGAARTLAMELK